MRAGPGALTPFFGLWLKAQGFAAAEIGLILTAPLFGRMVLAPGLGFWANRYRRLRTPMVLLCLAAAAAALALMKTHGLWPVFAAWFILCSSSGACTPLLDVATLKEAAQSDFAFSLPRGAAALAAIVSGVALGALFASLGPRVIPFWGLAGSLLAGVVIVVLVTAKTPRALSEPVDSTGTDKKGSISKAWSIFRPQNRVHFCEKRSRPAAEAAEAANARGVEPKAYGPKPSAIIVLVICSAGLIQLSHGMNGMAMLGWRARGIDAAWCGLLWQTGTVADIAFLWILSRYPIAPSRLLILGGLGAAARWAVFALTPPLAVLFLAQSLHALSFTATYIASVQLIDRLVAERGKLLVQSLYWAISTGLCTGLGVVGAGVLYQGAGLGGYWVMCALALVGLAVAWPAHRRLMQPRPLGRERDALAYAK